MFTKKEGKLQVCCILFELIYIQYTYIVGKYKIYLYDL
jgi:hypothetical protein